MGHTIGVKFIPSKTKRFALKFCSKVSKRLTVRRARCGKCIVQCERGFSDFHFALKSTSLARALADGGGRIGARLINFCRNLVNNGSQ